jgi:hypothetical protein
MHREGTCQTALGAQLCANKAGEKSQQRQLGEERGCQSHGFWPLSANQLVYLACRPLPREASWVGVGAPGAAAPLATRSAVKCQLEPLPSTSPPPTAATGTPDDKRRRRKHALAINAVCGRGGRRGRHPGGSAASCRAARQHRRPLTPHYQGKNKTTSSNSKPPA